MIRLIAISFFGLSFLAGLTLGHIGLGDINCLAFALLALIILRFVPQRLGNNGLVFGMAGAFFVSLLTPFALFFLVSPMDCEGDVCSITFEAEPT